MKLWRLAAVLAVAMGASACSSVPDWVDPTTWMGDSTPPAQGADDGQTPDLADLPAKPTPQSTPDDQKQVTDSLAADRSQATYSGDQLRGGTEPAAAPPEAVDPNAANVASTAEQTPTAPADANANPPASAAPDTSTAPAAGDTSAPGTPASNQNSQAVPAPDAASAQTSAASPPPSQEEATALPPASQEAAAGPPPGAEPAVPMTSAPAATSPAPMVASVGAVNPSDAALGFRPSTAPPLDPSVSQFVANPIVARYHQTASQAGIASGNTVVAMASPRPRYSRGAMGGPETMSGAVVANLDALQSAPSVSAAYSSANGTPAAVIFFPGDGTTLNADARAKVREAVAAFRNSGGQGFVHVVGHSSSRTANMPVEQHLEVIFRRSKERADAVARELIREGVPPAKVLVDAVGDSQPVYYESMPKGEDGNRRAEIFLQG